MKNSILIPKSLIIIFMVVVAAITIVGGWGAIYDAISEFVKFIITLIIVAFTCYIIYLFMLAFKILKK